jgi:hypothetical protein
VSGAQRDSRLGRAVECDRDHADAARLAGGVTARGDRDRARRAAEQPFADGAQQHPTERPMVRGADDDQVGLLGHSGVVQPTGRRARCLQQSLYMAHSGHARELAGCLLQRRCRAFALTAVDYGGTGLLADVLDPDRGDDAREQQIGAARRCEIDPQRTRIGALLGR